MPELTGNLLRSPPRMPGLAAHGIARPRPSWIAAGLLGAAVFFTEATFREVDVTRFTFDWQIAMRLAICLACGLYGLLHLPAAIRLWRTPSGLLAVLFGVWAAITVPTAVRPSYSAGACIALWCMLVFAPVVAQELGERQVVRVLLVALSVLLAGSWIVHYGLSWGPSAHEEEPWRLAGLQHATHTGREAALMAGLLLVAGAQGWLRWPWVSGGILFCMATAVHSGCRTGMVAALVVLMLGALSRFRPAVLAAALSLAVAAICLTGVFLGDDLAEMASRRGLALLSRSGDASEVVTLTGRTDLWDFVLEAVGRSPLVGYGYGCSRFVIAENHEFATHHAHNVLLNIMLYSGVVGGAIFGLMILRQLTLMVLRPHLFADIATALVVVVGLTDAVIFSPIPDSHTLVWLIALYAREVPCGGDGISPAIGEATER